MGDEQDFLLRDRDSYSWMRPGWLFHSTRNGCPYSRRVRPAHAHTSYRDSAHGHSGADGDSHARPSYSDSSAYSDDGQPADRRTNRPDFSNRCATHRDANSSRLSDTCTFADARRSSRSLCCEHAN